MAEIPFERLLAGLEAVRGTFLANPTRYLNMAGTVAPRKERYRPDESRGTLAEYYRSVDVRRWCEFEGEGGLDVYTLPLLLNSLVAGGIDGSGAVDATLTVDPAGANNSILYTAVTGGSVGNQISIEYVDPSANNSPLDVDVDDNAIIVYLATGAGGAITTIGDDITAAILAHPLASTMVTAVDAGGDDGSEVVTAMARDFLTGGTGADITTPGGAVLSRLWTFAPTMDADDLDSMTIYWGDPNVQEFRSAYCMIDEMTISADASGTDGVTISISGQGNFPSKNAPGAVPAMLEGPMLLPSDMQLWIDSGAGAIGTTPITGRVISAEVTIPSGVTRKWLAAGPASTLDFQAIGRTKRHAEMKVAFELPDTTEYDLWTAQTHLKTRLRINGALIEAGFYHYVEFDIYGPFDAMDWGEHEGSNRTLELTIMSEYDDTATVDWAVKVQSDRDAL